MLRIDRRSFSEIDQKAKAYEDDGTMHNVHHTWAFDVEHGGAWYDDTDGRWLELGDYALAEEVYPDGLQCLWSYNEVARYCDS